MRTEVFRASFHGPLRNRKLDRKCACSLQLSMSAIVLFFKQKELTLSEIRGLLTKPEPAKISYVPAVKPRAGEVYLYSPGENPSKSGK